MFLKSKLECPFEDFLARKAAIAYILKTSEMFLSLRIL